MASLSADAFTERMLYKSAKKALDDMPEHLRQSEQAIADHLEEMANRGRRFGQEFTEAELIKIERFLEELGCPLQIVPASGVHEVTGFINKFGKPTVIPANAGAMFTCTTKKMKLVLREKATLYEYFHEMMHLQHSRKLGLKSYYKLGLSENGLLIKEQYVFDKIIDNKDLFTREELKSALWYVNEINKKFQIPPIVLSFDINEIPEVRKEVNIEEIFKIK